MSANDHKLDPDDLKMVNGGANNCKVQSTDDGKKVSCSGCQNVFTVPYGTKKTVCKECGRSIEITY